MLICGEQGIRWDLSRMRISYMFTKRKTKTEKFEKILKPVKCHKFYDYRYILTASDKFSHSIFNQNLMKPASFLRLHKEQKNRRKNRIQKNEREKCRAKSH